MHNNPPEKSGYFLNSLAKGLRRLQVIAAEGQAMSLTEIARSTNVNKASATRLCYTLTQLGFLQKDRRKYDRLTPKILQLGYPSICRMEWYNIAYHYRQGRFHKR